jgi:Flp pilus assembly protein TadG
MSIGVVRSFSQDECGGITIFVLILSVMLLVVGGMAVDYQRYELARADLQDALDRGVLAATNNKTKYDTSGELSLDEQAKDLIWSYFASRNYRPEGVGLTVAVNQTTGGRAITASALPDSLSASIGSTK